MAAKPDLPSALDELEQPRPRSDLKAKLPPRETVSDDVIEQNSRAIGGQWGANTRLPAPEQRVAIAKMRVDIPEYVFEQIKRKCFEENGTQPYYILKGLKAIGFDVNDEDLVPDRRKRGQR
jgi:hypothetical protein